LLKRVIREEMWHEYLAANREVMHFQTFHAFIISPWGLDTTLSMLQKICDKDLEAMDLLDQVMLRYRGGQEANQNAAHVAAMPQGSLFPGEADHQTNVNIVDIRLETERPRGNARARALRDLRDKRPDIHARVLAGELSPHKGMIEAGFRHEPTPLDYLHRYWRKVSPEDRARFLVEMLTPTERRLVATGLWPEEDPLEPQPAQHPEEGPGRQAKRHRFTEHVEQERHTGAHVLQGLACPRGRIIQHDEEEQSDAGPTEGNEEQRGYRQGRQRDPQQGNEHER
jgi:hypothetical protein